ncbi:MAG: histidine phosphatase family protein [Anaerolineae bacterium]|jgi:serine/threonine-protein phosphatase PGAM5|nr:histidine phosphatase family protein [Anaerolineae bacterium]
MAKRYLYLIRHGQYTVTPDLPYGKLTRLGVRQAELTGQHLLDVPVKAIYASSMSRALETAQIIAENFYGVPVQPQDVLRECVPTIPPRLEAQLHEYARHAADFNLGDVVVHQMQADEAFDQFFQPLTNHLEGDSHELLVCHGNILRYFICRVLETPADAWANLYILHCGISVVRVDEEGLCTLMSHNATEHLPPRMRTEV